MKKLLFGFILALFLPFPVSARETVTDWYVKDFNTNIKVGLDSSIEVTEKIVADCGNLPNKHGIFRVFPTKYRNDNGKVIQTPIEIISVTDFNGNKYKYSKNKSMGGVITLKIGDPDVTVTGVNNYQITYKVLNALDLTDGGFDRFNWNLTGSNWDIQIDRASVKVVFPKNVSNKNVTYDVYLGTQGQKGSEGVVAGWTSDNEFFAQRDGVIFPGQGLTLDAKWPKGTFSPAKLGFFDVYPLGILWLLLPVLVFIFVYRLWHKYGNDKKDKRPIVVQYEAPEKLTPSEASYLEKGVNSNKSISAEIINMALKGFLKIEEIDGKFLKGKNFKLILLKTDFSKLEGHQAYLISKIFRTHQKLKSFKMSGKKEEFDSPASYKSEAGIKEVKLSELKDDFYPDVQEFGRRLENRMISKGYFTKEGFKYRNILMYTGIGVFFVAFIGLGDGLVLSWYFFASFILCGIILFVFSLFMSKTSPQGVETMWKIRGLKMYMEKAEKYRQRFFEKEGIFEELLPYAMVFGMTKEWIKKMEQIYGQDFYKNHAPIWYVGNLGSFDADSFTSSLSSVATSVSSSSMSGSGGAGGGGGGGGGGGW